MPALRIFARGNVDVRDSLLWSRVGNVVQWNGINEILRARHPGFIARVKHETCARLDMLPLPGERPVGPAPEFAQRIPASAHPLDRQHRTALFDAPADVVVFSLQSLILSSLLRHRSNDWSFLPDDVESWGPELRAWVASEFRNAGLASIDASMERLKHLVTAVQETHGAHVLIYNVSSYVPGELVHSWVGAEGALSVRIRAFNLKLIELSMQMGFSIVDIERLVAGAGAQRLKVDVVHLTAEGWKLVAEEVVRILEELGCFDATQGAI